jgi:hypothetical protein
MGLVLISTGVSFLLAMRLGRFLQAVDQKEGVSN